MIEEVDPEEQQEVKKRRLLKPDGLDGVGAHQSSGSGAALAVGEKDKAKVIREESSREVGQEEIARLVRERKVRHAERVAKMEGFEEQAEVIC